LILKIRAEKKKRLRANRDGVTDSAESAEVAVGGATAVDIPPDDTDGKWILAKEIDVPLAESTSSLLRSMAAAAAGTAGRNAEEEEGEKEAMVK